MRAKHDSFTGDIQHAGIAELRKYLPDVWWRLHNLYSVRPEGGGRPMAFHPRPEQELIFRHLLEKPLVPAYIIKSRRLGFSTGLGIFSTDLCAWTGGQQVSLVDMTQPDAQKKMREIIRYCFDSMPESLKTGFETPKRDESQLSIRCRGASPEMDSHIYAGLNARGGDNSLLWVSEWGKFATDPKDRERSREIREGAWASARKGRKVVETTWRGGRAGDLWEMIQPVIEQNPNAEGVIYFFPWHSDPQCVSITGEITHDVAEYFRELGDKIGKDFSDEQKKWWAVNHLTFKNGMKTEFPSTLDEALSAPGLQPKFSQRGLDWMERMRQKTDPTTGYIKHDKATGRAQLVPTTVMDETAWFREWERPMRGREYIIPIDFCTAKQVVTGDPDFHALPVLRASFMDENRVIHPARTVGAIMVSCRDGLKVFCDHVAAIQAYYAGAMVVPEINNMHGIIELLREAGVENIYERTLHPDSKGDKRQRKEPGWDTTSATKPVMLASLEAMIDGEGLIVECAHMLTELRMFQITNQAAGGHHDDWVMALGIGVHNLPFATKYDPQVQMRARQDGVVSPSDFFAAGSRGMFDNTNGRSMLS
jgi:hypothetical protein